MTAATTSSYLKYLPPVLWSPPPLAGDFGLGSMLCVFEKMLTGIDDGVPIVHGDDSLMTLVIQAVAPSPLPQTVRIQPGTGAKFQPNSSYTFDGATPEVIGVTAASANTITAVFRQQHVANQAIYNTSGVHSDIQSIIANLVALYGAWTTPAVNFDWLAQWVALQDDAAWDDYTRRSVLSEIVGFYSARGTKAGLNRFFQIYALAQQRPRVAIDDSSKILFCQPAGAQSAPAPTLVSQKPLIAPVCLCMDAGGNLLVGDVGGGTGSGYDAAVWRITPSGEYDCAPGPPPARQPFQTATEPVAIAADPSGNGAWLVDIVASGTELRWLSKAQVGAVTLGGGAGAAGETGSFTVGGTTYVLPQTGGATPSAQASAWAAGLNATAPFNATYLATAGGATITLTTLTGEPANDLALAFSSNAGAAGALTLSATGPGFASAATFVANPTLDLALPRGVVIGPAGHPFAGHPLLLDRGDIETNPSKTAIIDVQASGSPPVLGAITRHAFPAIVEPLSIAARADGSLLVGDGALQSSATAADIFQIDSTLATAASLLGAVPAGDNPLVAPVGIVEADAQHLWVLDAGLRPLAIPDPMSFTCIIAQDAAIYAVDLSVAPPTITRVSQPGIAVYPRAMVGDGRGTLYLCDSGLPDVPGYNFQQVRVQDQLAAAIVHFEQDASHCVYCLTLSGVPTTGEACSLSIGGVAYPLSETTGDTLPAQAAAWAQSLNGDPGFADGYIALADGDLVAVYAPNGADVKGAAMSVTSSAHLAVTGGRLAAALTLSGAPTTGQQATITVAGTAYHLAETTPASGTPPAVALADQASAFAAALNAQAPFNQTHQAVAADGVLSIYYLSSDIGDTVPVFVVPSLSLQVTIYAPPLLVGSVSLSGVPTTGESVTLVVDGTSLTPLTEASGNSPAQQAALWTGLLNTNAAYHSFQTNYLAMNSATTISFFALHAESAIGILLSAMSSPHLFLQTWSITQSRSQFVQSINDVMADEIPVHAEWTVYSDQ